MEILQRLVEINLVGWYLHAAVSQQEHDHIKVITLETRKSDAEQVKNLGSFFIGI